MSGVSSSRPELKIDKADEAGFVAFIRSLSRGEDPQNKDTSTPLRIFERADYFTCHGADAVFVANNVYRTNSVLKYIGSAEQSTGLPSCTLSPAVLSSLIREALFERGMKIEIYSSVGRNKWAVTKRASPGNLQAIEEYLSSSQLESSPVVLAVKISSTAESKTVGVCFADASIRELGVSEFVDNDLFSNFESLIIQLGVKECLIPRDESRKDYDLSKLQSVIERCGVLVTERKSTEFQTRDIEQDLGRLLSGDISSSLLTNLNQKLAMGAASCLISYLELTSDSSNFGHYKLFQHNLSEYMRLDASALKALNLMPTARDGAKSMSLYGLLNHCKTAGGSRLLAQWLKQPLMDLDQIERRHSLVEALVSDTQLRQSLQEFHLTAVPDIHRMAKKFQRGAASLQDVVRIYQVVIRLPDLLTALSETESTYLELLTEEFVLEFTKCSENLQNFQELVETTVDLDALDNHEFVIKPEFDENLKAIRKRLENYRDEISRIHLSSGDDLGMEPEKKLKLENHHVFGWCMRLTRTDAGCLRNNKSYIELSTQKAGVYFTTSGLRSLNDKFREQSDLYSRTQSSVVREVVQIAATYGPVFEKLSTKLAHLDVIVSYAHVSVHARTPYVRPKMHARNSGNTILTEARHPCMEAQDEVTFIPNDVSLIRGSAEFLIITGPNMGGKSTYIRQIGVIALMAQAGCFVPCTEAELCIFDSILARVGAGDSQLKGVSTFMAEMLETATILKSATSESLIVIDELGRGTSTYDGFGLAWAISEYIVKNIKCFGMFATHFHELTGLSTDWPQVRNLHVVAHVDKSQKDDSEITLLYKVEEGISDQSFGIHVAELVKFPQKVVKMAKRKASELEDFSGVTADEKTKCSREELAEGSAQIKKLLKEWSSLVKPNEMDDQKAIELLVSLSDEQKIKELPIMKEINSL